MQEFRCGHLTTTKLPLPIYHCQVITRQLNTANSLRGQLTTGRDPAGREASGQSDDWELPTEEELGRWVSKQVSTVQSTAGGCPFSHFVTAAAGHLAMAAVFRPFGGGGGRGSGQ